MLRYFQKIKLNGQITYDEFTDNPKNPNSNAVEVLVLDVKEGDEVYVGLVFDQYPEKIETLEQYRLRINNLATNASIGSGLFNPKQEVVSDTNNFLAEVKELQKEEFKNSTTSAGVTIEEQGYLKTIMEKVKKYRDYKGVCPICNGSGSVALPRSTKVISCPRCKNQLSGGVANAEVDTDVTLAEKLMIPKRYIGKMFSIRDLEATVNADPDTVDSTLYLSTLNEFYSTVSVGGQYPYSLMVYSPQGCGKDEFVFTSMQMILSKGMTVAPYFDTSELNMIYNNALYNTNLSDLTDTANPGSVTYNMNDLIYPDYCFIKVAVAGVNLKRNIQLLQMLVDQRARKGKPTIILSNFNINYLIKAEKSLDRFIVKQKSEFNYSQPYYVELKTNYFRGNKYQQQ